MARALLAQPDFILADAPTPGIDAACAELQLLAGRLFGMAAAIRCALMDPESHVTRK